MEPDYSKREIDEMNKDIKDALIRIENQTIKTNGSVAEIKKWKERWTGASYVLVLLILPILSWALYQLTIIDSKIKLSIQESLSAYDIELKK